MMKAQQMVNSRGNVVNNQFVLTDGVVTVFQSYMSVIAEVNRELKTIKIFEDYDYSNTTQKYRNLFFAKYVNMLGLASKADLDRAIKKGVYGDYTVEMA